MRHDEEEEAREGPERDHPFVRWHEAAVGERRDDSEYGEGVRADPFADEHGPRTGGNAQVHQYQRVPGQVHHYVIAQHYEQKYPSERATELVITLEVLEPMLCLAVSIIVHGSSTADELLAGRLLLFGLGVSEVEAKYAREYLPAEKHKEG